MNLFYRILNLLEATMETPTNFGWFHLMFIAIAILSTVFLCVKFRNCSDKVFRQIALIGWILIVSLEVYKQIIYSYNFDNGVVTWDYQWYAFPYQFCSTPLYALPFIIFLKDGKIRDAFIMYMSTFSLFAGLAVFAYPNDVFISIIGINIQTMIHHGLQIVFGIYFAVYSRKKYTLYSFLKSVYVFVGFSLLAILLDISVYKIFITKGIDETFNMFFISPYFPCTLPVLSIIYEKINYIIFLFMYIIGFVFAALSAYGVEKLFINLSRKEKKNA
jgi:hypothetical protein